jgi:hypothetical protein
MRKANNGGNGERERGKEISSYLLTLQGKIKRLHSQFDKL